MTSLGILYTTGAENDSIAVKAITNSELTDGLNVLWNSMNGTALQVSDHSIHQGWKGRLSVVVFYLAGMDKRQLRPQPLESSES